MEELIKKSVEGMVERLRNVPWFENCGMMNSTSQFEISYAKDVSSVIKHCSSIRWENLLLEKGDDVSAYITAYRVKTKYRWNDVVTVIEKEILPYLLEDIEKK